MGPGRHPHDPKNGDILGFGFSWGDASLCWMYLTNSTTVRTPHPLSQNNSCTSVYIQRKFRAHTLLGAAISLRSKVYNESESESEIEHPVEYHLVYIDLFPEKNMKERKKRTESRGGPDLVTFAEYRRYQRLSHSPKCFDQLIKRKERERACLRRL